MSSSGQQGVAKGGGVWCLLSSSGCCRRCHPSVLRWSRSGRSVRRAVAGHGRLPLCAAPRHRVSIVMPIVRMPTATSPPIIACCCCLRNRMEQHRHGGVTVGTNEQNSDGRTADRAASERRRWRHPPTRHCHTRVTIAQRRRCGTNANQSTERRGNSGKQDERRIHRVQQTTGVPARLWPACASAGSRVIPPHVSTHPDPAHPPVACDTCAHHCACCLLVDIVLWQLETPHRPPPFPPLPAVFSPRHGRRSRRFRR